MNRYCCWNTVHQHSQSNLGDHGNRGHLGRRRGDLANTIRRREREHPSWFWGRGDPKQHRINIAYISVFIWVCEYSSCQVSAFFYPFKTVEDGLACIDLHPMIGEIWR
jgi:hypothetical protein